MPLSKLRKEINKIDDDIVGLLKKRKKVVEKVAKVKVKHGLEIFDKKRENEIAGKLNKLAKKHGLRKGFLYQIWDHLMDEAKEIQKKIVK
jgi:chorismate mutase / prephenate dehydratase